MSTTDENYPSIVCSLVRDMGWSSGFCLPFANAENQALEKLLEERQRELVDIKSQIVVDSEYVKSLDKHITTAKQDLNLTQTLLNAKKTALESEQNYFQISQRLGNKVKADVFKIQGELREVLERNCNKEAYLERKKCIVEELKELIQFDQKALKEWEMKVLRNEDEIDAVEKIKEFDEKQVADLETKQNLLTAQNKKLILELDKYSMNTKNTQEQFDRVSSEFRKMHKQRQEIVDFWANSLAVMKRKDEMMSCFAKEFDILKEDLKRVDCELKSRLKSIQLGEECCKSADLELCSLEKSIGQLKTGLCRTKERFTRLNDELCSQHMHISKGSQEIQDAQAQMNKFNTNVCDYYDKIHLLEDVVRDLRERNCNISLRAKDVDCIVGELDSLLEKEEERSICLDKEMEKLRTFNWEKTLEKNVLEKELGLMDAKHQVVAIQNKDQAQLDFKNMEILAKNQSGIYRLDLNISSLHARMQRLSNLGQDADYLEIQADLNKLKEEDMRLLSEEKFAQKELETLQNILQIHNKNIDKFRQEKSKLKEILYIVSHDCDKIEKHLKDLIKEHQELQMNNSLEIVKLKRLEDQIHGKRGELESVAQTKSSIMKVVNDRKSEIEAHRFIKMTMLRNLKCEVTRVNTNYLDVTNYLTKLKGRYELTTGAQSQNVEETGLEDEIERIEKEKKALQIELEEWHQRIKEAQNVFEGISNVHKVMKCSNDSFKESLSPLDDRSEEAERLAMFECEEKRLLLILGQFKKSKEFLNRQIVGMTHCTTARAQDITHFNRVFEQKYSLTLTIINDITCQRDKLERWDKLASRMAREVRQILNPSQLYAAETELKRKFINEKFKCSMTMVERALGAYTHLRDQAIVFLNIHQVPQDIDQRIRSVKSLTSFHIPSTESLFPEISIKRKYNECTPRPLTIGGSGSKSSRSSIIQETHQSNSTRFSYKSTVRGTTS